LDVEINRGKRIFRSSGLLAVDKNLSIKVNSLKDDLLLQIAQKTRARRELGPVPPGMFLGPAASLPRIVTDVRVRHAAQTHQIQMNLARHLRRQTLRVGLRE